MLTRYQKCRLFVGDRLCVTRLTPGKLFLKCSNYKRPFLFTCFQIEKKCELLMIQFELECLSYSIDISREGFVSCLLTIALLLYHLGMFCFSVIYEFFYFSVPVSSSRTLAILRCKLRFLKSVTFI